jgi:exosortase/archaeosortase family protein
MALFYGLVHSPRNEGTLFEPYLSGVASITGGLLRVDKTVGSPRFSFTIVRGCDAIEPTAIFIAAVIASPIPFLPKLLGALMGTIGLFILNLARLVGLFYVGERFPSAFEFVHEDIGQFLFVLIAVALWAMWGLWAKRTLAVSANASA